MSNCVADDVNGASAPNQQNSQPKAGVSKNLIGFWKNWKTVSVALEIMVETDGDKALVSSKNAFVMFTENKDIREILQGRGVSSNSFEKMYSSLKKAAVEVKDAQDELGKLLRLPTPGQNNLNATRVALEQRINKAVSEVCSQHEKTHVVQALLSQLGLKIVTIESSKKVTQQKASLREKCCEAIDDAMQEKANELGIGLTEFVADTKEDQAKRVNLARQVLQDQREQGKALRESARGRLGDFNLEALEQSITSQTKQAMLQHEENNRKLHDMMAKQNEMIQLLLASQGISQLAQREARGSSISVVGNHIASHQSTSNRTFFMTPDSVLARRKFGTNLTNNVANSSVQSGSSKRSKLDATQSEDLIEEIKAQIAEALKQNDVELAGSLLQKIESLTTRKFDTVDLAFDDDDVEEDEV